MTSDIQGFGPNSRQTHIASPKPQAEEKEQLETGSWQEIALSKKEYTQKINKFHLEEQIFSQEKLKFNRDNLLTQENREIDRSFSELDSIENQEILNTFNEMNHETNALKEKILESFPQFKNEEE